MVELRLKDVDVEFSLYQAPARSLKHLLIKSATAGRIGSSEQDGRINVRALNGITLELHEGDRLALIGGNGAGKTTLLRVMAGLYHPTRGSLRHQGRRTTLFDIASGFDDEATGFENILLRGLLLGLSRAEAKARMDEIAAFSGLGDFMHLPVRTYSSGMLFRLLFSIATSIHSDIVLMDEWIATGDKEFIEKSNQRLLNLIDNAKILVFASHNGELLRKLCNRAVLLDNGRIKMIGHIDDVLEVYAENKHTLVE